MQVNLESNKYTLTFDEAEGTLVANRNGEYWMDYTGNKLVYSLMARIVELESNHKPALTQNEIIDAFCKTPDIRQHVSAFKAGVEYAESYHGIK